MRAIDADALLEDVRKNSESYFADDFAKYWVDKQPTIEPERKRGKGKWITSNRALCEADFIQCSECGFMSHPMIVRWDRGLGYGVIGKLELPYECPNCHVDMRGGEEDG